MKKYLMTGIAALAMCFGFTSCSHDPGFEQTTPEQLAKAQYEAAFIKAFGQPAANQDWGFGTNVTRSVEKETHTLLNDFGLTKPTLKDGEAAAVMKWFQENDGENSVGLDITKFFIIYVGGNQTVNIHKHDWDQNNYNNINKAKGIESNFIDTYLTNQNVVLDYLHINGEHILDWNSNGGVTAYVYNSKADNFRARNSYLTGGTETLTTTKWKLAKITYDGEEGWYVGLSAYGKKYIETKETLPGSNIFEDRADYTDYDREDFYDDWVFKIVPAEPVANPNYRVIAEDLNASEKTDFDFNDVVFDVIPNEAKTAAKIVLRAAGGIYKLTVAGSEVHEAFAAAYPDAGYGVGANGLYPMINTNPWNPEIKVTLFENYEGDFSDASIRNTIRNIEIRVYKPGFEENGIVLDATTGKAACKILVDDTFTVVTERFGIADEYNDFTTYVQGYFENEFWWKKGTAPQTGN